MIPTPMRFSDGRDANPPQHVPVTRQTFWTWLTAGLLSAAGLVLAHGLREPVVEPAITRSLLLAAIILFLLSRLLMLLPPMRASRSLIRRWPDYLLLVAAGSWWVIEPSRGTLVLNLAAVYILLSGAVALTAAAVGALVAEVAQRRGRPVFWTFLGGWAAVALIGGLILALPVSWAAASTGQTTYRQAVHVLDCIFTATGALTGTGLPLLDLGTQFSRFGLIVILILMLAGGLAILIIASVIGWRVRSLIGWGSSGQDNSPAGLRRLIGFACVAAIVLQVAGAAALYHTWDASIDPNLATIATRPALLEELWPGADARWDEPRLLASAFHSVSAFCNVGLVLPRDGMIAYRDRPPVYGVLLPLMVLGSLGGPVLYELWRRVIRPFGPGPLSREARVTLAGTGILIIVGAGLLVGIESTRESQLRYPRDRTPGRLKLTEEPPDRMPIVFSIQESERARSERMETMPPARRAAVGLWHSIAARGAGMPAARLDEASISPAGRTVLMLWMLVGGGLGGTSGGLRIVIVYLLLASVIGHLRTATGPSVPSADARQRVELAAGGLAVAMITVLAVTSLALVYRESASPEVCVFEAVSATCNVGLSAGLTRQLSVQGRVVLIVAMLLGRILPLAILFAAVRRPRPADPQGPLTCEAEPLEVARC